MKQLYGLLTFLACLAIAADGARGATMSLFASKNASPFELYSLDSSTGAGTTVGSSTFALGLDFGPGNVLYGVAGGLFTVNPQTGASSSIGILADVMDSLAFSPIGELYAVNANATTLYKLNPATGPTIVPIQLSGTAASEINGIDFAPDGTLYGIGFGLYTIDVSTGAATRITPQGTDIAVSTLFLDMDYGADGLIRAVSFDGTGVNSKLFTISPETGLGVANASTNLNLHGFASVPEPSCIMLAIAGLATLTMFRRYRRAGGAVS